MSNPVNSNIRAYIIELLRAILKKHSLWDKLESDIAIRCADLPIANSEKKKEQLIIKLDELYQFLVDKGVSKENLVDFEEEIKRFRLTYQISLYEEKEDQIPPEIINKYSRMGYGTEGIVGIHLGLNYSQLAKLTNGVYKQTSLIKFFVSREFTTYGKIIAEIYEHPQKIPVATLLISKRETEKDSGIYDKRIVLFGTAYNKQKWEVLKEIEVPFYVYRFLTTQDNEFIMFSAERKDIGDYVVTGVTTQITDYKTLTDSAKLPTKLPYIFVQECKDRILKYASKTEFKKRLKELKVNRANLFNLPFTVKYDNKRVLLKQPTWFKWLIWSWLTHSRQGMFNKYPLHILMLGEHHSGKSLLLNSLHEMGREARDIFSGSSSTLKSLVPSFKYTPAKLGYLTESNRFSYCDEFLRCIIRNGSKGNDDKIEEVAIMNDLLEHQKREAGSGVSRVKVNMTARVISTTNPIKGIHCVTDLLHTFDASFLSRWLVYYQLREHTNLIRESDDAELPVYDYDLPNEDWVSLLDFLHSFDSVFDKKRVLKLYESFKEVLNEDLLEHYSARHKHHIMCVMDGIIKTRCMMEKDTTFNAKEEDYTILEMVWSKIIASWVNGIDIKKLPIGGRLRYIPSDAQFVFKKLTEAKKPISRLELQEICTQDLSIWAFRNACIILIDNDLMIDYDGYLKPYYMLDGVDEK